MFGLFKKKERKNMALDQKDLEKLKGLSDEDRQALIEELSKEKSEAPKGEEDETKGDNDKSDDVEKKQTDQTKQQETQEETNEPDKQEPEKQETKKQETQKQTDEEPAWVKKLSKTLESVADENKELKKEVEDLKKKRPVGFEAQATPKHDDEKELDSKVKNYTRNKWS